MRQEKTPTKADATAESRGRKTEQGIYCGEHRKTCCPECGACPADPQKHHSYCSQFQTRHTPGPWKQYAGFVYSEGENGANICAVCEPRASTTVGYTPIRTGSKGAREAHANARLIAAAPELLEALQAMMGAYSNGNELPSYESTEPAWIKARVAIKSAEGTNL